MKNQNYPLYEVESPNNLKVLLNQVADKYGDNSAFTFERKKETINVSYRQLKTETEALGAAFFDMGIQNTKIAVIGENSYEWILTYFSTVNSGNVIVPIDKELPMEDIKTLVEHSETVVFVYSNTYADVATYLKENVSTVQQYIGMNYLIELIEKGKELIQNGNKHIVDFEVDNYSMTALLYTSGTTGNSKGVMLTHEGLVKSAIGASKNILFLESGLLVLPLHHCFALNAVVLTMLISGATIIINQSLKNIQSDMAKYKPRNTFMVPLLVETFYKQIHAMAKGSSDSEVLKKIASAAFGGNLEIIVSGGAPLDRKYIDGYRKVGISILEGYGLTECSAVVSVNRNQWYRVGSVGQVVDTCEVKIFEPDANGHGEIYVKGDIVMLGYYKNEHATKDTFDDGWLKTGDIGYLDDEGFLYISGRKKNVIILSNGTNVYPEEVEFAMLKYISYMKEVVVSAGDNEIIAEVFLDTDNHPNCTSLLESDIIGFNRTLPIYKNIGKTIIRETQFPKTTTKKIKRQYN